MRLYTADRHVINFRHAFSVIRWHILYKAYVIYLIGFPYILDDLLILEVSSGPEKFVVLVFIVAATAI